MAAMVPPSPGAAPQKKPIAGAAEDRRLGAAPLLAGEPDACPGRARSAWCRCSVPSTMRPTSAMREQPDHDDQEAHAVLQLRTNPMVKRGTPLCRSMPMVASARPMKDRDQSLGEGIAGERAHRRQREQHQGEIFRAARISAPTAGERHGDEGERGDAERAGDEGADGRDGERRAGPALAGQG